MHAPNSQAFRRGKDYPLPTVAQVEDALDLLLTAIIEHDREQAAKRKPLFVLRSLDLSTEFLPGEMFLADPVGRSLREGVRQLGLCLFALSLSIDAMGESCERVSSRDPSHSDYRSMIMDKRWSGIGEGNNRWWS